MQSFYEVVVVIPIGPGTNPSFLLDTIESFRHYNRSTYRILLCDDSQQGIADAVQQMFTDIDVINMPSPSGSMAGLFISLCTAYRYALDHYHFSLLFKLDTDALVIGPAPEKEALALFREAPNVAIAGQYPLDYQGNHWDVGWPRARIINGTMTWKFIKRPLANILLRKLYLQALKNGYRTGESVFGGAYYISPIFLKRLHEKHMLPDHRLRKLNMGEDHLFALLAKAFGMDLGNLSGPQLPFGCAWKGLPVSPEELLRDQKKIIHSTRRWNHLDEAQIRDFFKQKRQSPPERVPAAAATA